MRGGRSFFGQCFKVKIRPNQLSHPRFGFIIGLALSKKAVVRNRLRRRLSEIVRLELKNNWLQAGFDCVFLVKPDILKLNFSTLRREAKRILQQAGLNNKTQRLC